MAFKELSGFLRRLEEEGELRRVTVEVDPILEIAEITDRESKSPSGGKALFFERVGRSQFPVVTNMFGSRRRICLALGINDLNELSIRMERLLAMVRAGTAEDRIKSMALLPEFARFAPQPVAHGPCREVVESGPDLDDYPILTNFVGDGRPDNDGRFITLPMVITRDPDSGRANSGMYRVEVIGKDRVCIHWRETSGGAGHWRKYRERDERMPVAVAVGGDPAAIYAASAPLPESLDEMFFAGFLMGEPVSLVSCMTNGLKVPAGSEMVIEGFIEPGESCLGGAFGNHTGFYDLPRESPLMRVACITRRKEMIYPATVVGRPPMEDCWLAKASERLLLTMLRLELPEVIEINMPLEGIFHGCAIVAIEKSGPDHPREVMEAIWRGKWLGSARLLLVVDADSDICDISQVAWKVINLVDWRSDLFIDPMTGKNIPLGRLGLDATRKAGNAHGNVEFSAEIGRGESIVDTVDRRWREYGF